MKTALNRAPASFPVRRMDYNFENIPRYWCNHDPSLTHYFTGLSTLFPEGESYFVRSVRALRAKAKENETSERLVRSLAKKQCILRSIMLFMLVHSSMV